MKKTILLLITFAIANYAFAQNDSTNDSLQTDRNFYLTAYSGLSTLVGNLGIEVQYKNYGYNIGLTHYSEEIGPFTILSGGMRYYFKPYNNSWVISFGGGVVLDDLKPDDYHSWISKKFNINFTEEKNRYVSISKAIHHKFNQSHFLKKLNRQLKR